MQISAYSILVPLVSINDLYSVIRYPFGYLFCDYIKKSTRKGIKNVVGSCK